MTVNFPTLIIVLTLTKYRIENYEIMITSFPCAFARVKRLSLISDEFSFFPHICEVPKLNVRFNIYLSKCMFHREKSHQNAFNLQQPISNWGKCAICAQNRLLLVFHTDALSLRKGFFSAVTFWLLDFKIERLSNWSLESLDA